MDIFRRKIFYSIAYLATSLVLLSCTEKDNLLGNPTKTKSATKSSIIDFKVSEEEAIETLNGILNATYPSNTAIANFKRKEIGRIDYIIMVFVPLMVMSPILLIHLCMLLILKTTMDMLLCLPTSGHIQYMR